MKNVLLLMVAASLVGCGDDEITVRVDLYEAQYENPTDPRNQLLGLSSTTALVEILLVGKNAVFGGTHDLISGKADLSGIPTDDTYRVVVRGLTPPAGPAGPISMDFFGGSPEVTFNGEDFTTVPVQVGSADCIGLNGPSRWQSARPNGDLNEQRTGSQDSLLPDGRILISGGAVVDRNGSTQSVLNSLEIYDPLHSMFVLLPFTMSSPRVHHTATVTDDGGVLIYGGLSQVSAGQVTTVGTAEYISPEALNGDVLGSVSIAVDQSFTPRYHHGASILQDRSILISGGKSADGQALKSTLRFFPTAFDGTFDPVVQGEMHNARTRHSSTAINRTTEWALLGGGQDDTGALSTVEIFTVNPGQAGCFGGLTASPRVGCFIQPQGIGLGTARWGHAAVAVEQSSKVVFIGGYTGLDDQNPTSSVEIFDGNQLRLDPAGSIGQPRGDLVAIPMSDGEGDYILVAGGRRAGIPQGATERLVPTGGNTYRTDVLPGNCQLPEARYGLMGLPLANGTAILVGGVTQDASGGWLTSRRSEIYFPRSAPLY